MATCVDTRSRLLEVNNLSVDYLTATGVVHAVTDVSFTLERGETLGLAGESGCGKSTLAYAIFRLLRPPAIITGGEVLYCPPARADERDNALLIETDLLQAANLLKDQATTEVVDVLQLTPRQLQEFRWEEMSIVLQSAMNALNPVMDIGSQIMDVLQAHRPQMGTEARKKRVLELLKLVGIAPDRLHSYPHELSGGMRQRAIIAMALALSPEIIILDEPTTALDVVVQREILNEVMRLQQQLGFSVIFITHDLSLLLELADKVAIMYAGRIVEMTTRRDLYLHPLHPYSYGLLHSFPTLHGPQRKMLGIPGSPPDLQETPLGCAFHPRCPFAFGACKSELPLLSQAIPEAPEQLIACHLYNSRFNTDRPSAADFARKYESLAERKEGSEAP